MVREVTAREIFQMLEALEKEESRGTVSDEVNEMEQRMIIRKAGIKDPEGFVQMTNEVAMSLVSNHEPQTIEDLVMLVSAALGKGIECGLRLAGEPRIIVPGS